MKQRIRTILITLIFFIFAMPANAADYSFDELQMELTLPDQWITFTRDTAPEDQNLDILNMSYEALMEYFVQSNRYLLTISDDYLFQMEFEVSSSWYSSKHYSLTDVTEPVLQEIAMEIKEDYEEEATCTGLDIYTSDNQFHYILLQYYFDDESYYQEYLTICNGQWISLILRSYEREIPAEIAAVQREIIDSLKITEVPAPSLQTTVTEDKVSDTFSPEILGRFLASVFMNILFICFIIFVLWNKTLKWLKKRRGWAAELEGSGIAVQFEKRDCLKKANYEIIQYVIMGVLYLITVYLVLIICITDLSMRFTLLALVIYAFYSLIKNRKESLKIIDRILTDVCPEKKKFYHILIAMMMLLFLIIVCWPLAFAIYLLGIMIYIFLF